MPTTYRPMGVMNARLHEPTGMVIAFLRDPAKSPYLKYTQLIPAPGRLFMYFTVDPDEATRLPTINEYAWGWDDQAPTGQGFTVRGKWTEGRVGRWAFPYTIGEATLEVWRAQGIDPKMLYDSMRANHAALHRASRIVTAMSNGFTGGNTSSLNDLLGTVGAYFDKSSGQQYDPATGADNPNFQIIKRALQKIKRRINLATNASVTGEQHCLVIPPVVADAMAASGEMVEFLKQNPLVERLTDPNLADWSLPAYYYGWKVVVEDTPRCFINQKADGTVADVSVSSEKDYILNTDTIYCVSRVGGDNGGLDGGYGFKNFSTVQCYHFNGEARVEAFNDPENELIRGRVVYEDCPVIAAPLSGFKLTDVLS